jgi:hypothetical protein
MENNNIEEKLIDVTLFSTRFIPTKEEDKNKYLFNASERLHSSWLQDYYLNGLKGAVSMLLNEKIENNNKKITQLLVSHLEKTKEQGENLTNLFTDSDKIEGDEYPDTPPEQIIADSINIEIDDKNEDALIARIEQWGLEETVKAIVPDDKRFFIYRLPNSNVFAVWCPDVGDRDSSGNRWIPCLIKCLHELTKQEDGSYPPLNIQLVLHDMDLDSNSHYAGHFTYIENGINLAGGSLKKGDKCQILFFMHTIGGIVDLLTNPQADKKTIHTEVDKVMKNYGELGKIREEGNSALEKEDGLKTYRGNIKDRLDNLLKEL